MGKQAEELFIENGEYRAPALRGAFHNWVDRDWSMAGNAESTIKVRKDHDEWICCYRNFESWLNRKVEDDWYSEIKEKYGADEPKEIFKEYWESDEDFRESVREHVRKVDLAGNPGTNTEGNKDRAKDEEAEKGEHSNQSSFGASQFPNLHGVGIVDDDGVLVKSKLRGLVKAFVKDIDQILGEDEKFDVKWAQRAFLYWGYDRWDKEWVSLTTKYLGTDEFYEAVGFIYASDSDSAEMMEEKYEGGQSLDLGNPDTDDLTESFLDSEVPGWNEEEEEDEEDERTDHWDEYEEKSKEKSRDGDKGTEDTTDDEESNKWDRFEEQSQSADDDGDDGEHEDGGVSNGETDAGTVDDDGADDDSPGTLGGWADKEGTTDDARQGNKQRGKTQGSIGDNGGSVQNGEQEPKKGTSGADGGSGSNGRRSGRNVREKQGNSVECEDGGRPYPIEWPEVGRIDDLERNKIYEGNTFEWAMKLPENSIDTLVTSPPYYALRDYDIDDAFPISGDFTCDHEWQDEFCMKCGAFLGQLGHEPDPALFIDHIVDLMERYKKVLKPSGSLWLNIGDTYAGSDMDGRVKANKKSRMMVPERIYRRMVQTGWHLRDYVIWVKKIWLPDDDLQGNGKPFAGSSRLADQWEPMVRFTPESDHYSDVDSNRLLPPSFDGDLGSKGIEGKFREGEDTQRGKTYNELGTNPPDVWLINSDGYDGDHRAVFPEELPKRCIQISTPDRVCEVCGRPFDKEVHVEDGNKLSPGGDYSTYERRCKHKQGHEPGVAFDPFLGSGTTAVAAANSGFDWAGVELSEKYAKLARERIPMGRQVGLNQY